MNWLFLRGLAREQRHWGKFVETFAAKLGHQVHCLDLPGMGSERERQVPGSISANVDDVRARWLELKKGVEGPWGILGISMGGMLAMNWAGRFNDFDRVVLVNTSAGNLSRPWERMDLSVLPTVVRAMAGNDPERREERILGITARMIDRDKQLETAKEWAGYANERAPTRISVLRQLFAASRFRAPKALFGKALVVAGASDPLTNPTCAKRLAEHLEAPLAMHPKAGHDLPLDDPEWLCTQVSEWIQDSEGPEELDGEVKSKAG